MERNVSFDMAALEDVAVHVAWAQVEIFADDIEKLQVLASGDENSVKDLRIETEGNTLLIEQPQYGLYLNLADSRWMQVCVRVPRKWEKTIHVSTIGGILNARGLQGSAILLDTISGELHAARLKATKELSLKTISGDIRAAELQGEQITARTVSGNVTLDDASAQSYKCTTVSGEQKLRLCAACQTMELRSVSGDVIVSLPVPRMNVNMRSVSGRVITDGVEITEDKDVPTLRVTGVSADLKLIGVKE